MARMGALRPTGVRAGAFVPDVRAAGPAVGRGISGGAAGK